MANKHMFNLTYTEYTFKKQGVIKKNFFNVYLFLRERQNVSEGGAEREGDTESEAGSGFELSAQSPTRGSNSRTGRS